MIFTFYSYKGGVGRSMALANVAACFQQAGLRVAIVDWDLEAPGIESYLVSDPVELEEIRSSIGLVDILASYRRQFPNLELPHSAPASASPQETLDAAVEVLEQRLPPLVHALYPLRGKGGSVIHLLHAGWRAGERFKFYAESVQSFDWAEFYADYRGEAYFEWMRRQLLNDSVADVVLIDSRTGVTEMGGVCTRQLADVVVCLSAMNQQNLQGSAKMAASFARTDLIERRGRPLRSIFVPARVDSFNTALKNEFQKEFVENFDAYMPTVLRTLKAQFWDLRIPYISDYAYRERLTVGDPHADKDLEEAYRKVAAHMSMLAPLGSSLRARYAPEIKRIFGRQLPEVIVVYPEGGLRGDALDIIVLLQKAGLSTWPEPIEIPPGATAELHSAIAQSRLVVALTDAASAESGWLRGAWRAARERGLGFYPVRKADATPPEMSRLPAWMRQESMLELPRDEQDLLQRLRFPRVPPRVLKMDPPLATRHVVDRTETAALTEALRRASTGEAASTLVLWGLAGSGKSVLAGILCRDEQVQDLFPDGVLWVTLTPAVDPCVELRRCLQACGRSVPLRAGQEDLRRELELQLKTRQCLVVIDEAQDAEQVRIFMVAGHGSAHLVTTRVRSLAYALDTEPFTVGQLSSEEARRLLTHRVAGAVKYDESETTPDLVDSLILKVGGLPLGVDLINRDLQRRVGQGQGLAAALSALKESLDKVGFDALEQPLSKGASESIESSIALSFDGLSPEDKARLIDLAEQALVTRTTADAFAARLQESPERLAVWLDHMADLALLEFNHVLGTVSLHPLVQWFLVTRSRAERRSHPELQLPFTSGSAAPDSSRADQAAPRVMTRAGSVARSNTVEARQESPATVMNAAPTYAPLEAASAVAAPAERKPRAGLRRMPVLLGSLATVVTALFIWRATLSRNALSEPPPAALVPDIPVAALSATARLGPEAQLAQQQLRFARQALTAGQYDVALLQYQQALALDPMAPEAWFGQANAELQLGRHDDAILHFGQALRLQSDQTADGRELLVLSHLGRAAAFADRTAGGNRGPLDLGKGDGKQALDEVDQALALDPGNSEAHLRRAEVLERAGQKQQALSAYSRAIKLDPNLPTAYFQRGQIYQELGDSHSRDGREAWGRAEADFRKVLLLSNAEPRTVQAATARLKMMGYAVDAPHTPTSVYLHYAAATDAALVKRLADRLQSKGLVVPPPELFERRSMTADVRYFFPEDEDDARLVKSVVEAALAAEGIDLPVPTLAGTLEQFPSAKPQRLELWLPSLAQPTRKTLAPRLARALH